MGVVEEVPFTNNVISEEKRLYLDTFDINDTLDVSYTDLIHKELIHFSHRDIERNINNIR